MEKIETDILKHIYWKKTKVNEVEYDENLEWNIVRVYPSIIKHRWMGMGGSITESSCYNFNLLSKEKQKEFINAYYSKNGLNYNLARISIGSNDFCIKSYEYSKREDLSDFSIQHDKKHILPVINKILKEKNLTFIASPWSPPKFMKTNKELYNGGKLLKKYYPLYAEYLIKFLEAYKKENINIDYITIQNEPYACQKWESCQYSINEQKRFIYENFLKLLRKTDTKLLLWDHNKENLYNNINELYKLDEQIAGIAYHWYSGTHLTNLELVAQKYKDSLLIHTEGACYFSNYNEKEWIKDAEMYLFDLINDMNYGMNGYVDWNILLDFNGGPNHKNNFCKSPIILNENSSDFILTPIYYYLGHISKYVEPRAKILTVDTYLPNLLVIATKKENKIVTTILNSNNEKMELNLLINKTRIKDYINPHTICTYIDTI